MHNIETLRTGSEDVWDYLESSKAKTPKFQNRLDSYRLNPETVDKLRKYVDKATIVVFSAEWCKDCYNNVPVLAHLNRDTGLEVLVFGHLMRNSKNHGNRWSVPPSPSEVEEFDVQKIPLIIVLNAQGQVLGEIVENPPENKTLEQSLLDILDASF